MDIALQFRQPVFVMSAIDEEVGCDILEPTIMMNMHKCVLDNIFRNLEKNPCLIRNTSIGYLMFAEEIGLYIPILRKDDWRIPLKCDIFKSWVIPVENHWDSWLDDASLLIGNLLQSISEVLHMVV
jgi:hypothetical protein